MGVGDQHGQRLCRDADRNVVPGLDRVRRRFQRRPARRSLPLRRIDRGSGSRASTMLAPAFLLGWHRLAAGLDIIVGDFNGDRQSAICSPTTAHGHVDGTSPPRPRASGSHARRRLVVWVAHLACRLQWRPVDRSVPLSSGLWDRVSVRLDRCTSARSRPSPETWSPDWQVFPADFNGDGVSDIFLYAADTGAWFECLGIPGGTGFSAYLYRPVVAGLADSCERLRRRRPPAICSSTSRRSACLSVPLCRQRPVHLWQRHLGPGLADSQRDGPGPLQRRLRHQRPPPRPHQLPRHRS